MSFLNPLLLLGALGIALPILAHLLNRYKVKQTDWAAMRFLNRSVRVRSRQLRLRDLILLLLRCAAIVLLALGLSRPAWNGGGGTPGVLGGRRAGVIIALDASYSMQHQDGGTTRFQRALERVEQIAATVRPGDPLTLCLLGSETRVAVRNMAFDPDAFDQLLRSSQTTFERLDLEGVPSRLKDLVAEMRAPQKEVYIVTDMQEGDWSHGAAWLRESLAELARTASVFIIPIEGGPENLAITDLEMVAGVLRKGTSARYRATVRNCGATIARNVRVIGLVNDISTDVKVIPAIAPGVSETVSLFLTFRDPGPVRISAQIDDDGLTPDNERRTVAVIRDRISVLCVQGASEDDHGATRPIVEALRARGNEEAQNDLEVQLVAWVDLPAADLTAFDVVVLADVPDITAKQASAFDQYVREGHGLIWFGGAQVKADIWNERSMVNGTRLLPAVLEPAVSTGDAMGVGRPLDPAMPDHAVTRPLRSLPEDLLSETRFRKVLQIRPSAASTIVLSLAGSDLPVLVEHSIGRGHVFMFTTSASPAWNNMAVTPAFPMLLQQMVTYMTAREFETPRRVGESLMLSYVDQPDTADAVFDAPSGDSKSVPVRDYRSQYVAVLDRAREAGFYEARVSLHAEGRPIAVNVDTSESNVKSLPPSDAIARLQGTDVKVVGSEMELAAGIEDARTKWSLWPILMLTGLAFLIVESLLADWLAGRSVKPDHAAGASWVGGER